MAKVARVVAVTMGLIVGGSGLGGCYGVALLGMLECFIDPLGVLPRDQEAEMLASVVGSVVGGLLGPLVAWTALGKLPLSRTFAHTGGGAFIGGAVGSFWSNGNPALVLGSATLGMVVGALALRLRMRTLNDAPSSRPAV